MQPSREDIIEIVTQNEEPYAEDGKSNVDRMLFIFRTFGCETIRLSESFDFSLPLRIADADKVLASIYLAMIQHQIATMMAAAGYLDQNDADLMCAFLHLAILKMRWHHKHLTANKVTPPFPFLH